MNDSDWYALTSATAAMCVALVFLRAAWHKIADVGAFCGFVADYRIVPEGLVSAVSRAIIVAECSVTVALIPPVSRPFGGYLATAMLLGYAAAMTANIMRGRLRLECGCGGAPQVLSWPLVVRNVVLTGMAMLTLRSINEGMTVTKTLVVLVSGLTLWIGYVLTEQILANASRARWSFGGSVW
jgi:hypothetical protein